MEFERSHFSLNVLCTQENMLIPRTPRQCTHALLFLALTLPLLHTAVTSADSPAMRYIRAKSRILVQLSRLQTKLVRTFFG